MIRKLLIVAICLGFISFGAAPSEAHYTGPRPVRAVMRATVKVARVPLIVAGKTLKAVRPKNVAKRIRARRVARNCG